MTSPSRTERRGDEQLKGELLHFCPHVQRDNEDDIIMVPQNDISGATRKAFLYTEKGYRNVIVEKYSGAKD